MKCRILMFAPTLLAAACWGAEVKLPPPFATPSVTNRPRVIPQPQGAQLHVPDGFTVEVFAEGFEQPRNMVLGPGNEILVSDSRSGKVYIVQPQRKKLIENLDRPSGLAFWKNYLYIAEATSVKRYEYDANQKSLGAGKEVVSMKDFTKGHWTRSVLFDKAGSKMYVGIGSSSNVDAGDPAMRAAINRFNPDGSGHEIFASGTRNPDAIRWNPTTNSLWASVQERDGLGDDLVPDYLTSIQHGGFYGWPFAYIGQNEDPRHAGEQADLVKKAIAPDMLLVSHSAVMDFVFYTGKQFPQEYQGGAFLAFHGSVNRSTRVGHSVGFIPFKNGRPSGPMTSFLTGWMISPDSADVWGRPVGLLQLPDGSLLVSEDGNNRIYRVSYGK